MIRSFVPCYQHVITIPLIRKGTRVVKLQRYHRLVSLFRRRFPLSSSRKAEGERCSSFAFRPPFIELSASHP